MVEWGSDGVVDGWTEKNLSQAGIHSNFYKNSKISHKISKMSIY